MGKQDTVDENTLLWHLRSNHYPPLPDSLVTPAKWAIRKAECGDFERKRRLPKGMTYKGRATISVEELLDSLHLWDFVDAGAGLEEEEEGE